MRRLVAAFVGVALLACGLAPGVGHESSAGAQAGCSEPSFVTAPRFLVRKSPSALAVGDFNADGVEDLAVANAASDSVSILLGDGSGGFAPARHFAAGSGPSSVAVGDFDADGTLDLAVANSGSDSVSVLLGDGAGSFELTVEVVVGEKPFSVAVADFNADGIPDFVVASDRTVSVLLGDGAGGFALAADFKLPGSLPPAGAGHQSMAVADFDMDGNLDVALVRFFDTLDILLGDGAGGFRASIARPQGRNPRRLAVADFNGDGVPDLAVTLGGPSTGFGSLGLLLGTGDAGFTWHGGLVVVANPGSVAVGDFNGDSIGDLAVVSASSNTVALVLADAEGTFGPPRRFAAGPGPLSPVVGDFNGDGTADLALANSGSDSISVLIGDGAGGLAAVPGFPVGKAHRSVAVADLNVDGTSDLVVAHAGAVSVLLGTGAGHFADASHASFGRDPGRLALGDFNGDGVPDVATANRFSGTASILFGEGTGGFHVTTEVAVGGMRDPPDFLTAGDFNADGKADLAVANSGSDSISVLLGDGFGGLSAPVDSGLGEKPRLLVVGDFNVDGKQDVAVSNSASNTISVLLGDGVGGFAMASDIAVARTASATSMALGDFNADGKPDLVVATSVLSVLIGDGTGGFEWAMDLRVGGPGSVAVADFNADGNLDLAVAVYGPAVSSRREPDRGDLSVLLGDGAGGFSPSTSFPVVGQHPTSVAVGDFNADGLPDLAVASYSKANPGPDSISVLLNTCGAPPTASG